VFSTNPELKAHEVRTILLETATGRVTERYTNPWDARVAALAHPIPIVDAAAAVDAALAPELTISVDPTSGLATGDYAFFSSTVEHGLRPFVYAWDFGDGGTSILGDDSHAFQTAGVFTVTATVSDLLGREVKAQLQVTVAAGDGGTVNADDYVIWYTGNVSCWDAPLIYITHRDDFEREELASNFPGGGIDQTTLVEKRLFQDGFATTEAARQWICPQITGWYYHYWCTRHYVIGDKPYQVGGLGCDLSNVPEIQ
jgi:hypothetical protein